MRPFSAFLALLVVSANQTAVLGQLSKPIVHDGQIDAQNNKWLRRRAHHDDTVPSQNDEVSVSGQCDANLALKWMAETSSSIYATPLIHDLFSDGHKDIIVPSFVHYVEVVDGGTGAKAAEDGWPAFHASTVHTSPLAYDFDFDNVPDILVATYDGDILAFKDTGEQLSEKLTVPQLRVHKDWYRGLAEDFIDHSHPDVGDAPDSQEATKASGRRRLSGEESEPQLRRRRLLEQSAEAAAQISEDAAASFVELFGEGDGKAEETSGNAAQQSVASVEEMAGAQEVSWAKMPLDADGLSQGSWHDSYGGHYHDYGANSGWRAQPDHAWADEAYFSAPHKPEQGFVWIDSHILCTPAIGDIDGDGSEELVVAASYFFDRDYYEDPEHRSQLEKDLDTAKYIAGGIIVFDLVSREVKWTQHLDLSTDHTQFRAYIYSAPTLADLDGDGKLEIIVGTSMGFLYVLDWKGRTVEGWPLQMGEIQAQAAVADLKGDGGLAIVVADARGNVAAFDAAANELWERHLGSLIAQAPTFADVDGDGWLEVLLGSTSGGIHVLSAASGLDMNNFPVYTQGRIMAPITPSRVRPGAALQLIVPSYDGHLYVVDGITGCVDVVDIGETAYAMVLADDLDGNGKMDLLLATMNGNLYAFQTAMPYDPAVVWPAQVLEGSGFTSKSGWLNVAATPSTRRPRDVRGQDLSVRFEIRDDRPRAGNATLGPYTISISLQGVGKAEMNAGEEPVIGVSDAYASAGVYTVKVPCPRTRSTAAVKIVLRDGRGQIVADEFSLSFHMHFHRLLKWILAAPFAAASLIILSQQAEALRLSLPSTV